MSLQYLLDGYNIIHKIPAALEGKLEDQRQYLVRFIENNQPQGSKRNHVTIVFDGQSHIWGSGSLGVVKVIFSEGKTADDVIKKIVEESLNAKCIVVVTDDRDIQYSVRANGAKIQSVADFLAMARKTGKKISTSSKRVGQAVESKITAELEDIWLKSKKDQEHKKKN